MTDLRMARTLGHRRRTRHAAASGGCRSASHPGQQSNFNLAKKSVASTRRRRPLLHAATRSHPPKIVAAHYGLKVLLELASLADERDDIARGPHVLWRRLHRDDHSPPVRLMADNSPYRSPRSPATKRFQPRRALTHGHQSTSFDPRPSIMLNGSLI